jgi:hypothetical protein
MRNALILPALLLPLLLWGSGEKKPLLEANVAYAKPMQFDYDRDGKMNDIQMWASVKIEQTKEGYTGYLRRYMRDVKSGKAILGYADINMLPDQPYGEKIPVSKVRQNGKTVLFKAGSKHYIMVDGGKGYKNDTIIVNDGNRDYLVELYAGDVKITTESSTKE